LCVEQYYANGPRVPELNIEPCVSDDPGGTSGHVVQRCVTKGLRASFGHLFMVSDAVGPLDCCVPRDCGVASSFDVVAAAAAVSVS
jgi:hypothetical protein